MIRLRVPAFVKVVVGVLLLQLVTVLLVIVALRSNDLWRDGPLFVLVGAIMGLLAAFWFSSIHSGHRHVAVAEAREGFSREREKIRVKAEKEKARLMVNSEKKVARERGSGGGIGFSRKNGVAVLGVVGVGAVLLVSQFLTLGLAALAAAGGSVVGYKMRGFQEKNTGRLPFGGWGDKALTVEPAKPITKRVAARRVTAAEVRRLDKQG